MSRRSGHRDGSRSRTVESMMSTIHAHPTGIYAEAIGEAFNNVYGLAINI